MAKVLRNLLNRNFLFISERDMSKYHGVNFQSKNNVWETKREFDGELVYGEVFPLDEHAIAAKASDELVFQFMKNGGKLSGKTKINFRDDRVQNLDKATREHICILEESDSENSDSEDSVPLQSLTSKISDGMF